MVEQDDIRTAARELHATVQAEDSERDERQNDQRTRNRIRDLTLAYEVEMNIVEPVLRPLAGERDAAEFRNDRLDQDTRNEDRAEQRGQDTDNQRRSEALHGTVTENEEDDTRDDRRKVTVDNGGIGVRETVLDSQRQPLAGSQLLFDTFVDNHVGIDGHTHRQNDTRNTGQR